MPAAAIRAADTPELIWTHHMRLERLVPQARLLPAGPTLGLCHSTGICLHSAAARFWVCSRCHSDAHAPRLVLQMLRHLGDFPRRLRECSHAVYEYTPCPPVGYPEIEVGAAQWAAGGVLPAARVQHCSRQLCAALLERLRFAKMIVQAPCHSASTDLPTRTAPRPAPHLAAAGRGVLAPLHPEASNHAAMRCATVTTCIQPACLPPQGEVFCHRYYLKHLCDEQRHSGWPLADHVQLLQASQECARCCVAAASLHWAHRPG